jgi:Spy/CpxP family protein refolding chaperone
MGEPRFGSRRPNAANAQVRQRLQQRLMQVIGLTDNQRSRMADIRRSHEEDLIAAGRRMRMARRDLDRAIMNERYDQTLINRRADELAAAQAELIRLQTRVRSEVRSVLTPEQVIRFNELERQLRRRQREQRETQQQSDDADRSRNDTRPPSQSINRDLTSLLLGIREIP